MGISLVVLAAGMGSRYWWLKQIDSVWPSGETILHYCIFDAIRAWFDKVVFVIRKDFEQEFKDKFHDDIASKVEVEYVFQEMDNLPEWYSLEIQREKPWGTAHALWVAKSKIEWNFAMINADDFYWRDGFEVAANFLNNDVNENNYWIISYKLGNSLSDNWTVNRGVCETKDGKYMSWISECKWVFKQKIDWVEKILYTNDDWVEVELDSDSPVSMNFFAFHENIFDRIESHFKVFLDNNKHETKKECYIPDVLDDLYKNWKVRIELLTCDSISFGVTYREDKPMVIENINVLIAKGEYPDKLF